MAGADEFRTGDASRRHAVASAFNLSDRSQAQHVRDALSRVTPVDISGGASTVQNAPMTGGGELLAAYRRWHAQDFTTEPHAEALREAQKALAKAMAALSTPTKKVRKNGKEHRYTLGVAYPANKADVSRAVDGYRDFASAEALEAAAWDFLRKGGRIGLHHANGTDGAGEVVESYVYRGPDWLQPDGSVVKAGDWLVGVKWDKAAWAAIKAGRVRGLSPQGTARRRRPSPDALAGLRGRNG